MDDLLGPQRGPSSPAKINAEVRAVKLRLEEVENEKVHKEEEDEHGS